MTPRAARTLTWVSSLLLLLGGLVGAPEAGLGAAGLAGLAALVPLLTPGVRWRVAGAVLLALALATAWSLWPAASRQQEAYRARATGSPAR